MSILDRDPVFKRLISRLPIPNITLTEKEMACIDSRRNHRYKPTTHEKVVLKFNDKVYGRCLECGSPNLKSKETSK